MKRKLTVAAMLISFTAFAQAQEAKAPEQAPPAAKPATPFTFALHGFVSGSSYVQDANLGLSEGQQSIFVSGAQPATDKAALGFDVRQSRFNFSVKGPEVLMGATPSAVLEIDFFQGFGAGGFGDVSLLNRMRLAYSELNWGNHRIAVGQMNDIIFALSANSLSHIATPIGFGTGNIGWRRPGVYGFHNFGLAPSLNLELAWEVGRSQWNDAATGIGANLPNTPYGLSLGEASALPAVEARATVSSGSAFSAFAAGHWNRVDLTGVGATGLAGNLDVAAGALGGKGAYGPVTLAACGYFGKNTGALLGNLVQFQPGGAVGTPPTGTPAAATFQNVNSWGAWAQAGLNLTKELSAWAFYGLQKVDDDQAKKANFKLLRNSTTDLALQYREGGYGVAAEWIQFRTKNATYTGTPAAFTDAKTLIGNQYIATANYFF